MTGTPSGTIPRMSKIIKSADAPEGEIRYSYGMTSFAIGGDQGSYVTDDHVVLAQAAVEPWLDVEVDEAPAAEVVAPDAAVEPAATPTDPTQAAVQNTSINEAPVEPVQAPPVDPAAQSGRKR